MKILYCAEALSILRRQLFYLDVQGKIPSAILYVPEDGSRIIRVVVLLVYWHHALLLRSGKGCDPDESDDQCSSSRLPNDGKPVASKL